MAGLTGPLRQPGPPDRLAGPAAPPGSASRTAALAAPVALGGPAGAEDRIAEDRIVGEAFAHGLIPFLGLAVSVLLTAVVPVEQPGWPAWPDRPATLGLAGVAAAWMLWFRVLHPAWVHRRRLMAGYFVGLTALVALLVAGAPWFGFFAFAGYLESTSVLPGRWRLVGTAVTGLLTTLSQVGGVPTSWGYFSLYLVVAGFNVAVASTMTWFAVVADRQRAARRRAIGELADANRRLQAALTENAGLHAQLVVQAREAGVLDERARLAREIHDTLAQGLTGIITQLRAAERAGARGRHLDTALRLASESLTEARRSVRALSPVELAEATLPDALADVAARWTQASGVPTEVSTTGSVVALHPEVEATVLRVAQESLANVAKHGRASRVGLTLSYMSDLVTVDIRDDGVGFDVARADTAAADTADTAAAGAAGPGGRGGFGLPGMRQRVARLAGTLAVESEPGAGTAISAAIPAIPAPRVETAPRRTAPPWRAATGMPNAADMVGARDVEAGPVVVAVAAVAADVADVADVARMDTHA
ncbi:sensor histidine kinase [Frankia nepalensis]|uniref:sensor histidine kinase n=1 Tax=Frankia nepalensis TaxID=1836974 RepID=UPI0027DB6245|nr:sensor histidine kinase [Frankia nepalensis]